MFHLSALICRGCCCVASWPVCQRFSLRVAHRQHHHCCVVELVCFLAFEEVSAEMLPHEWSAARWRVLLDTYWDHTIACMFKMTAHIYPDTWHTSVTGGSHFLWIKDVPEPFVQGVLALWRENSEEWKREGETVNLRLILTFLSVVADIFLGFFQWAYEWIKHCARTVPRFPWGLSTCLRFL